MSFPVNNPKIAKIYANAMAHTPRGNVIRLTTFTENSDNPMRPGELTPTTRDLKYEARVCAIPVDTVRRNADMYRYSDMLLLVAKDDMTDAEANDASINWIVNDTVYTVKNFRPAPSTWEFIIRRSDTP